MTVFHPQRVAAAAADVVVVDLRQRHRVVVHPKDLDNPRTLKLRQTSVLVARHQFAVVHHHHLHHVLRSSCEEDNYQPCVDCIVHDRRHCCHGHVHHHCAVVVVVVDAPS